MIRFYLAEGSVYSIQSLMDIWSKAHPEALLDDIDLDYTIDNDGKWHVMLAYQDNS